MGETISTEGLGPPKVHRTLYMAHLEYALRPSPQPVWLTMYTSSLGNVRCAGLQKCSFHFSTLTILKICCVECTEVFQ